VVPAGPDNPLGKYKFTLGWASYLIHGTNKPYGVGLRSSHGCIRLYPEDIEQLYNSIPIGTQVRVVNQPYVFALQDGELMLQAYGVLEDDTRSWAKAQRTLMAKAMTPQLQKAVKDGALAIDWDAVNSVTHKPRGLPVRVSKVAEGATADPATVDAVVAAATLVQNRIPAGSNWDGADDIERDEASYQQLLREREKPTMAAPGAAVTTQAPAETVPLQTQRATVVGSPAARGARG
jgi:L,D-transpeptidase ErfK/SrfK